MVSKNFQGQVAIVTGAGVGIGYEICLRLAEQGASVLLNDIDESLASEAAAEINKQFGNCIVLPGDAGDPAFITKMVETAVSQFGKLTIAIANAGITLFGDFLEYDPGSLYKVLHTNIGGSFFL